LIKQKKVKKIFLHRTVENNKINEHISKNLAIRCKKLSESNLFITAGRYE